MFMRPAHKTIATALALAAAIALGGSAESSPHAPTPAPVQTPASTETRGVWVLRTSLTSPASIARMVQQVRAAGLNTILVQVRGRGEAFYRSDLEPRATELASQPAAFDPLETTLTVAHKAGLRVHAWVNVGLVSSAVTLPRSPQHVARRHPEWLMIPRALAAPLRNTNPSSPGYVQALARWSRENNTRVEGLFVSPIVPDAQEHSIAVVRELARRYALDGVHLDYIRFPNEEFDYSRAALAEFRRSRLGAVAPAERQRIDREMASRPSAWADAAPESWAAFRRERLTSLLTRIGAAARTERPGIVISAAAVPDAGDARARKFQDWEAWSKAGLIDILCPMAYTPQTPEFASRIEDAVETAGTTSVWAGIGAYRLSTAQTAAHVRAARRAGATGVLLFSYDSLADPKTKSRSLMALRPVLTEAR
jgi:uncharacterized lipoprotein YddW (UPF0748 family)